MSMYGVSKPLSYEKHIMHVCGWIRESMTKQNENNERQKTGDVCDRTMYLCFL